MNIFVLNCGSSSLKFQIIETDLEMIENDTEKMLAKGLIERVGSQSLITFQVEGKRPFKSAEPLRDHRAALNYAIKWITNPETEIPGLKDLSDIHAIGHRCVHGAERFKRCVKIDKDVIAGIEDCIPLAPLHNPANLKGIYAAKDIFGPSIPQVAVFDTSFHSTMPESAYMYAVPYQLYRRFKVRKYGFHGTSHRYVAYRYRKITGKTREETEIITLHLGNGCSACAIHDGKSIDTSMGFTPVDGLIMGTRTGEVDPGVLVYIADKEHLNVTGVSNMINKKSGVFGISQISSDMRDLQTAAEAGNKKAILAINMYAYKVKKFIGSYMAAMNGADVLVFTGGIGENHYKMRKQICSEMEDLGILFDDEINNGSSGIDIIISKPDSKVTVMAVTTDEELVIASDTRTIVEQQTL